MFEEQWPLIFPNNFLSKGIEKVFDDALILNNDATT